MDTETEELLVKIEEEAPVETSETDPSEDLKAQYEQIQKERDNERAAKEAAEARAREAQERAARSDREVSRVRTEVTDSQLATIVSGIEAAQTKADKAEAELVAAWEKGDHATAGKIQREMARAEAELLRLNEAKSDFEAKKTDPRPKDQFEDYVSQFTSQTQRWMREHKDWVTDPVKSEKLRKAHFHALGEDLVPDTDEYFEHVEKRIGLRQERQRDDSGKFVAKEEKPKRSAPPPAAPVNGGGAVSAVSGGSNTVHLAKHEVTAANDGTHVWRQHDLRAGRIKDASLIGQPIGTQEFARRKLSLTRQGAYDRTYTDQ